MKQKFFAIGAIAVIANRGVLFVFEHATSATTTRPERTRSTWKTVRAATGVAEE